MRLGLMQVWISPWTFGLRQVRVENVVVSSGASVMLLRNLRVLLWMVACLVLCEGTSDQTKASSPTFTGWKCCLDTKLSGTCSKDVEDTSFSPLIYYNRTFISSNKIVKWIPNPLPCSPGYQVKYFPINVSTSTVLYAKEEKVNLQLKEVLISTTFDICVKRNIFGGYDAGLCRPNLKELCANTTCVTRCCGPNEAYHPNTSACIPVEKDMFSLHYETIYGNPVWPADSHTVVSHNTPVCERLVVLNPLYDIKDNYFLLTDGRVYEESSGQRYTNDEYCLEYHVDQKAMVALVCAVQRSGALLVKDWLQTVGVLVSVVFLALSVIFHLAIPELRDMQGRCLLSYMASLLVADVTLFTSYHFSNHLTAVHCVINGIFLQYFFLAAFFWLNVMCFDIWRVIRATVRLIPLSGILENDKKKFRIYSLYSWGGPAVVSIITVALHVTPLKASATNIITPGLGEVSCWFRDDIELLAYFYGLVALLFAVNLVFLGHTICMLYKAGGAFQCCVRQVIGTSFNRHHVQVFWQRFSLFLVMALCWMSEVLSWKIPPAELWIPTDVLNSMQGFMVFVIFISSRKKREVVRKALSETMSKTVRKLSTSDSSGVMWHVSSSIVSLAVPHDVQEREPPK